MLFLPRLPNVSNTLSQTSHVTKNHCIRAYFDAGSSTSFSAGAASASSCLGGRRWWLPPGSIVATPAQRQLKLGSTHGVGAVAALSKT